MNHSNDNATRPEVQDDDIDLGVASIETKGGVIATEGFGGLPMPGISED